MTTDLNACHIMTGPYGICDMSFSGLFMSLKYRDNISELLLIVMLCNENHFDHAFIKHSIEVKSFCKKTLYIYIYKHAVCMP